MNDPDFVCALSGEGAEALDHEEGEPEDMPPGWAMVTIVKRLQNPEWLDIQAAKAGMVTQQLASVPEGERDAARPFVEITARALFAALETTTPRYLDSTRTAYVSPRHWPTFAEMMGEDDDDEPEDDEPEPALTVVPAAPPTPPAEDKPLPPKKRPARA